MGEVIAVERVEGVLILDLLQAEHVGPYSRFHVRRDPSRVRACASAPHFEVVTGRPPQQMIEHDRRQTRALRALDGDSIADVHVRDQRQRT